MNQVVGYLVLIAVLILLVAGGIISIYMWWNNRHVHSWDSTIEEKDGYKDTRLVCKLCGDVKVIEDSQRSRQCSHRWELLSSTPVYREYVHDDKNCIPMGHKCIHKCIRCGEEKVTKTW